MLSGDATEPPRHRSSQPRGTLVPTVILSTVELALSKLLGWNGAIKRALEGTRKIIIDEASLLTETALFCVMRAFPLELPPFMYKPGDLGQELAGKSALEIAMKNSRIPILTVTDVFRAPQCLKRRYYPLTTHLNVPHGPQLLYIEFNGRQETDDRSKSLFNVKEGDVLMTPKTTYGCVLFQTSQNIPRWLRRSHHDCLHVQGDGKTFGESSSVSLGNLTSIAHLDHQEEDPGRILIVSCDLRRLLREFTLNHASKDFGGWMIFFWIQTID
ncbi:hypothetical protein PRIPAC_74997 [Pristionchus pacificus]|uniref:Uncharacterized protein n=1 Tax=Pristionchus pacificus TaxID=54126 RepID=A0A2A6C7G5_PRIPA|nr:hypothetical protein PRIPAC_74997 [Pristionchus pacificus]|eukprot:PDM74135.1 hypothetical protein PRIPAC_41491 [Pristionchus pacificus]